MVSSYLSTYCVDVVVKCILVGSPGFVKVSLGDVHGMMNDDDNNDDDNDNDDNDDDEKCG